MELSKTEAIFRKEMHEKLENDFNEFVCYQKLVLDTLNAFHNVCSRILIIILHMVLYWEQ